MRTVSTGAHLISPKNEKKNYYLTQVNDDLVRSKFVGNPVSKNSNSIVCLKRVNKKPNTFKIIFPNEGAALCRDHFNKKIRACDMDTDLDYLEWKLTNVGKELFLIKYKDKCLTEMIPQSGVSGNLVALRKCNSKNQEKGKKLTNMWRIAKQNISSKDMPNCDKFKSDKNIEPVPDKESDDKFEEPLDNRPDKPLDELEAPKFKLQLVFGDHISDKTTKDKNGKYESDDKDSEDEDSEEQKEENEEIAGKMQKENGSDLLKIHGPTPESQDIVPPYSGKVQGPSLALRGNDPLPYLGEENQANLWSPKPAKNIPLYDHSFNERPKQKRVCKDEKTGEIRKYDKLMPYDQALADQQAKVNGEDGFVQSLLNQNLPHHDQNSVDLSTHVQKLNPQKDLSPVCSLGNSACSYLLKTPNQ